MFTQVVWWAGIALQILLLVRAAQEKLAKKFPLFYCYLAWVLLVELSCFYIYEWHPNFYPQVYWPTEFLSVIVGYGVIQEIYRRALINHPGVARLSQTVLLVLLFVTIAKVVADTLTSPLGSWMF